jgi:hypothetical protein
MNTVDTNSEQENLKSIRHRILFFFMPESLLFEKPTSKDDPDLIFLKSISPLFYWCSAHEFVDFDSDYKYLIQYQTYSVENQNIIPGEVIQKWSKTKYEIKNLMINFLNIWPEHKRILLNGTAEKENNNRKIFYFSDFAHFVAKSIFNLKHFYIEQANSSGKNFDALQKDFWKMIALNSYNYTTQKKEISKNIPTKRKRNSTNNKKTVKPKNSK